MTEHKIIDNFLPLDVFDKLKTFLLPVDHKKGVEQMPWYYVPDPLSNIINHTKVDWRLFYLVHMVYENTIISPVYEQIEPITKLIGIGKLTRIKINMYPNTQSIQEHGMDVDYPWQHKTALFSINTCDGYTKLEDGTKIDSVANRMLLLDASKLHAPSTTTNQPVRMNINFNYF